MSITTPVERGCGTRQEGGAYLCCGLSPYGTPLEDFLVDPPIVIDPDQLGVSPVGVTFIQRGDLWHVIDWIGSEHYPNVADFYEEGKRFGFSRRVAKTADFAKLTQGSRMLLVHARGHIDNALVYQNERVRAEYMRDITGEHIETISLWCPKKIPEHEAASFEAMCAGLWWEDVTGGEPTLFPEEIRGVHDRRYTSRTMPSFSYGAYSKPDDVTPAYKPAIFLALPITGIEVVRDPRDGSHVETAERASASGLPVIVTEE